LIQYKYVLKLTTSHQTGVSISINSTQISVLNILRQATIFKVGLRHKTRKAAMDRNYLATVLLG
ncbi:hypothetical protein, partial [Enterobacter cloacae complex sp. P36RS]|uniref:hypothetical protein n=1 Tax=Enterobacter cloacae complex sp. P36RS TaxID=2779555 RepID=UPI001D0CF86D